MGGYDLLTEEDFTMRDDNVYLSKTDAQALFGLDMCNAPQVLHHWQGMLTLENHLLLYPQLRFMCTLTTVYLGYQSVDVRYMIQSLLDQMISDIYHNEEVELPLSALKFMFPIVWLHRNLTDYRMVKKLAYKRELLESVRRHLLDLGALSTFQTTLF